MQVGKLLSEIGSDVLCVTRANVLFWFFIFFLNLFDILLILNAKQQKKIVV